jgi:predicted deacylase
MARASLVLSRVLSQVLAEKDRMIDVQVDLHRTEAEVAKDSLEILSVEVPDPADPADQVQAAQIKVALDQKDDVLTVPQADRKVDQWEDLECLARNQPVF